MTLDQVVDAIRAGRYAYHNEVTLHQGLEAALRHAGLDPEPEVPVVGGRIDFRVGNVGIEVKVKGAVEPLRRQVTRYTDEPSLDTILVVTIDPRHRAVAGLVNGKPIIVHQIGALAS